ncbi:MAG: sulfurtransferase-like selenium metabolism protein YedF [Nitrospirae bacterium]|nr:sulfurtransferase-like selenium metabolism protein YedF [Nitrospirota bacterium]MCL5978473.1 sulfurtransferase-like selenium metabolism protein YedF [Nitrospirota bacterium]
MLIDARGQACPKPVIMAEEALSKLEEGIVDVLVDNEASVKNLTRFATKNAFYSETVREDNYWRVKIVKGYPCEVPAEEERKEPEKDTLLIIGSDVMGKEDDLGKILMKAFFETMKVTKEIPHTIFFLNAGVKLTTVNEEIIPILKGLEAMGVEIFSCGTCLKHYNLESELKVGYRGTTNHIVEGMKDFKKTVWIS